MNLPRCLPHLLTLSFFLAPAATGGPLGAATPGVEPAAGRVVAAGELADSAGRFVLARPEGWSAGQRRAAGGGWSLTLTRRLAVAAPALEARGAGPFVHPALELHLVEGRRGLDAVLAELGLERGAGREIEVRVGPHPVRALAARDAAGTPVVIQTADQTSRVQPWQMPFGMPAPYQPSQAQGFHQTSLALVVRPATSVQADRARCPEQ
jgi:hypothetical protein